MALKLSVLMTVHNRPTETFRCLESLLGVAKHVEGLSLNVVLVDAGNDGTGAQAEARWAEVVSLSAGSDTYWAAGMRTAWEYAIQDTPDYLMWLNNDVVLLPHWYSDLFIDGVLDERYEHCVVVGPCADPDTGEPTYGGFDLVRGFNPINFRAVAPDGRYRSCDTLNGNVVVMALETDQIVGGFPRRYSHNLADLAYGLNATNARVPVILGPRPIGLCARNGPEHVNGGPIERVRSAFEVKNFPLKQWAGFCFTYGGIRGVLSIPRPYVRAVTGGRKFGGPSDEKSTGHAQSV